MKDMLALSRTSRPIRLLYERYQKSAFNIFKLFDPFIPSVDVGAFRRILQTSGGLIGGAAALQFLDRVTFGNASELDIYVPYKNISLLTDWFRCHGFNETVPECATIDVVSSYRQSSEIKDVTNFTAVNSVQVIQLISTMGDLALAVLDFHSSMLLCPLFQPRLC